MPPLHIFIAIVAIFFLIAILWEVKERYKNRQLFPSDEEKYAKQIKNGNVVIIPPKYGNFFSYSYPIQLIGFMVLSGWLASKVYDCLDGLAVNCQQIYGLNTLLLDDLISFSLMPIFILIIVILRLYTYQKMKARIGSFYPLIDSKPLFYKIICKKVDDLLLIKKKNELILTVFILVMFIILTPFRFAGSIDDIFQLNEVYHQKCITREYPFDRLQP